jgi:hypothetical protein
LELQHWSTLPEGQVAGGHYLPSEGLEDHAIERPSRKELDDLQDVLVRVQERLSDILNATTTLTATRTQTTSTTISTTPAVQIGGSYPSCGCSSCSSFCLDARTDTGFSSDTTRPWAFVTMAYDDPGAGLYAAPRPQPYLLSVLPLARALQRLSSFPLVLLTRASHFPDGTPVAEGFRGLNVRIHPLYAVTPANSARGATVAFWKMQIWTLTQFEKLIWLDTDSALYRSLDWLFERPGMWAQRDDPQCDGSAADKLSTGVMLLFPNVDDYHGLLNYTKHVADISDGGGELIRRYFAEVRKMPIQLLSNIDASYGSCIASGSTPYNNYKGEAVWGRWNTPAFVHKSGGAWDGSTDGTFSNMCFSHVLPRQYYRVGNTTVNLCQFYSLGAYWRNLFCDAVAYVGIRIIDVDEYCSNDCWYGRYGGRDPGADTCQDVSGAISQADYAARAVGRPLLDLHK